MDDRCLTALASLSTPTVGLIVEVCGLVIALFNPTLGILMVGIGSGMVLEHEWRRWRDRNG